MAASPDLKSVVQRMLDAGEPEENIATVIQHYKTQAPPVSMSDFKPYPINESGQRTDPKGNVVDPGWIGRLVDSAQGAAHPQSLTDMLPLLVPDVGQAIQTAGRTISANLGGIESGPLKTLPFRLLRRFRDPLTIGERTAEDTNTMLQRGPAPRLGQIQPPQPVETGPVTVQPPAAPGAPDVWDQMLSNARTAQPASGPSSVLSATDRATLAKQGYSPETIARIEAQLGAGAPQAPQPPAPTVSPFRPQRIAVGAEQTGRPLGLTKEAVRTQTGPVLDEAVGEASPILPREVLGRIVDKVKSLPPDAREAYVQAATSGKAKWQIENIRRTLEHLGLLAPIAIGAGTLRTGAGNMPPSP